MAPSRGVRIYGTYAVIVGTLGVVLNSTMPWLLRRTGHPHAIRPWAVAAGVGFGLLLLAAGLGAVRLKPWGRRVALLAAVCHLLMLAGDFSAAMTWNGPSKAGYLTTGVVELAILWFFTRPAVAAQFRRPV